MASARVIVPDVIELFEEGWERSGFSGRRGLGFLLRRAPLVRSNPPQDEFQQHGVSPSPGSPSLTCSQHEAEASPQASNVPFALSSSADPTDSRRFSSPDPPSAREVLERGATAPAPSESAGLLLRKIQEPRVALCECLGAGRSSTPLLEAVHFSASDSLVNLGSSVAVKSRTAPTGGSRSCPCGQHKGTAHSTKCKESQASRSDSSEGGACDPDRAGDCEPTEPGTCSGVDSLLTDDMLTLVFSFLSPHDLSHAAQVSSRWRNLASSPLLHALSFKKAWGLDWVSGVPTRRSFWQLRNPPFALQHPLRASDTVASVAVQYGCQLVPLRRINNMMSDHAIHTRNQLLVPLCFQVIRQWWFRHSSGHESSEELDQGQPLTANLGHLQPQEEMPQHQQHQPENQGDSADGAAVKEWLKGKACIIKFDKFAKRDVAVIFPSKDQALEADSCDSGTASEMASNNDSKRADARAKVVRLLMRAFGVDDATASYYLQEAGGDVRAASQHMRSDLQWECSHRVPGGI